MSMRIIRANVGATRTQVAIAVFSVFSLAVATCAYVRHLWWTLTILQNDGSALTAGKAIMAALGVVVPLFGALHGIWLWFH